MAEIFVLVCISVVLPLCVNIAERYNYEDNIIII